MEGIDFFLILTLGKDAFSIPKIQEVFYEDCKQSGRHEFKSQILADGDEVKW